MKRIIWLCLLSVIMIAGCKGGDYGSQTVVSAGEVKEFNAVISGGAGFAAYKSREKIKSLLKRKKE